MSKKMSKEELAKIDESAKALLNAMELANSVLPHDPQLPEWIREALALGECPTFMPYMGHAIRGGLRLHRRVREFHMETSVELSVDIHGDWDDPATRIELLTRVDLHARSVSLTISEGLATTDRYMKVLTSAARAEMFVSNALRLINGKHHKSPRVVLRRAVELHEVMSKNYAKLCDKHRPVRSEE